MDIRLLRYFIAVAHEQNISAAAKSLHITQPTLSRQLSDLEEALNTALFIRGNRKITLTEEGLFLLSKAKEIVELVDKTEANFNQPEALISGEIYIGGGETEAISFIADTLKDLKKDYPSIQFHLYSGNAEDIAEKLESGLLDFGIVIEPTDKQKYEFIQLPARDVWGVLMRNDSPLAHKTSIQPTDLLDKPLMISRQTTVDNELSGWFGTHIQNLNITGTYNLIYNASVMAEAGLGYVISIDKLINTSGKSQLCFKPLNPQLTAGLNIVWKKNQVFSNAAKKFLEKIRENIENNNQK
ncbi:LysR family transcriptional regulator [Mammaliicoccus vitulinus]|uniref:LysR family transcriptional regulator n=2 Tax=Mammaliicoccus vitulinus TaxID=71237 RepID=UPI00145B32BE|nr:LysR family transcriptional regulator [Mammaliicoccus vitulinus]MEB7656714.1 LysR family transcriptional regulator [Mammaliicoccus vitulinus]QJF25069.1 LysR family transcriptional regulator [Mammaliicoccus vitulinus]